MTHAVINGMIIINRGAFFISNTVSDLRNRFTLYERKGRRRAKFSAGFASGCMVNSHAFVTALAVECLNIFSAAVESYCVLYVLMYKICVRRMNATAF